MDTMDVDAEGIRARNRILIVLFLGVLMGALDIAIIGPALPAIQRSFEVEERTLAWIFTIYVLFNLVSTPLMSKLSDVYGRRALYTLDVALFALGSLLVAFAPAFGWLLLGRAVQGAGAGGIFPVASAVIGDTFPPDRRGRALGLIGAVFGLAFLIGPILGGALLRFGWPWLFLVNLPLAALVILLGLRLLPSAPPPERRPLDRAGMVTLAVLLGALAYGLDRIDTAHLGASLLSPQVGPFLLTALALFPVFVRLERRAPDPVLRLRVLGTRQALLASGLSIGAGFFEGSLVFLPAFLVTAYALKSSTASFLLLPAVLAMAVGAPLAGRLLDRVGSKSVVLAGTLLLAAGMLLLGTLASEAVAFYYGAVVLLGLGLASLLGAPLRYIMLGEAPASDRAAAQGAISLLTGIGLLVSGAVVGAIVDSLGGLAGFRTAYLFAAGLGVLLLVLSFGLKGREEERATVMRRERERESAAAAESSSQPAR